VIHNGVILREEKYLAGKFGEEYSSYKTRVRRWL
jgi:protein-S-isoprenylcysteine O-methyltransferase Ste14